MGQGPWLKAEELQGAAVQGAGSSRPSSRSPTGSQQQPQPQPQPTPARGLLGLRNGSFRRAAKSTKAAARKLSEASECGAALGIPKVALLFLTPGDMPLEQVCHCVSNTAGPLPVTLKQLECAAWLSCKLPCDFQMPVIGDLPATGQGPAISQSAR